MGIASLLLRVALVVVFVVSGVAKLVDRDGTRQAVVGFGVPSRYVAPVALLLAPSELVVALLLLLPSTSTVGLVLAFVLLAAFTTVVVAALRAGRRPDCHCFGRVGGADVSWRTVARNGALAGLAVAGLVVARGSRDDLTAAETTGAVLGGVLVAAALILVEGLAGRSARRARERQDAITSEQVERTTASDFRLPTPTGGEVSLAELLAPGLPLLLVSLSPGCGPCNRLRPDVAQWAQVLDEQVTVAVLASGTPEANRTAYDEMPHLPVLLDEGGVRDQLGTTGAPSAVVVGADGRVTSGVANGEQLVRRLVRNFLTGADVVDAEIDDEGLPADQLSLDSPVRARPGVEAHALHKSTMLLDTATGATLVVDQIGALVWSVLDGSLLRDIVADVADVFGAPAEVVGPDVLGLVQSLGRAGLLEGVSTRAHHAEEPAHAHG